MPRDLLPSVEKVRSSRLLRVFRNEYKQLQFDGAPPTKVSGFYWIYTNYSLDDIEGCVASPLGNAINIPLMAKLHRGLGNVCDIQEDGFRLVYNGIARASVGIRERLGQHFNGGDGTGSLHIKHTTLHELSRWRVSFVSTSGNGAIAADVESDFAHAKHLERIWRLEHGWPLLCMH
ncbi:MAG: hypothetical protein WC749_00015 [Dehalococcoidia bacterium]|uniref:hypothetical protein n=1 Tax=unclassified Pseudomonas TaxID=196821 RepID=UPI001474200A|nr:MULTISPECIES: hypothetical protein [unclassified Pseudomonas]NMX92438.1 hypothetical protein [Pseudomonas sp. WS 5086]NMY47063.1 hypothetical protein [Pseudomonas sp. WS 5027]